jgi:hypothetical protein
MSVKPPPFTRRFGLHLAFTCLTCVVACKGSPSADEARASRHARTAAQMRSQMDLFYRQAGRRCGESPDAFKRLILAHREFVGPVFINGVPVETIPDLPFLGGVQKAASTLDSGQSCARLIDSVAATLTPSKTSR